MEYSGLLRFLIRAIDYATPPIRTELVEPQLRSRPQWLKGAYATCQKNITQSLRFTEFADSFAS